ncbi:MAG TPA: dTMP kinase [Candidatus Krumholzibacteria bacterium]|nr:dTMP kinase [Candidatus Krumholzibacteria bacterium]
MPRNNARFIVFEGLDGAGTTTQAARLHDYFTRGGAASFLTHEPTPEPIGAFIRRLLTGREPGRDGSPYRPDERAMGLLFAADRLAHSGVITAALSRGHVVCDRYLLSSMAYQTLDARIGAEWVINVNRGCAIPDLTLFVAVPVDVCLARIGTRNAATSIYETRAQLETIAANYEKMLSVYEKQFGRVIRIDGTRAIDDVHAAVLNAVSSF